ncbi:MAG TPA: Zn-dependent hydrolase [Sutterella sp.]|nr:Zn-dependent hydrolase [Sutterella sp.]
MTFQEAARPIAEAFLDAVREDSKDGRGVSRQGYGPHEEFVHRLVKKAGERMGMEIEIDPAGNLWVTRPGKNRALPAIVSGSHGDSVPEGGNFDGLAGVCAALTVAEMLHKENVQLERDFTVLVTRMEESSWFGRAYVGSLALTGKLKPSEIQLCHRNTSVTLAETIRQCGFSPEIMVSGKMLKDLSNIAAFIELHIEQGPRLDSDTVNRIGVVTGIRGNLRHKICHVIGQTAHSGAVDLEFRHDAVMALAELLSRMDKHWKSWLAAGQDLVFTCGVVNTEPTAAIAIIPGKVSFGLDMRSLSMQTLWKFHELMETECAAISQERGVRFEFDDVLVCESSGVDPAVRLRLETAAKQHNLHAINLPSGAGHDAAVLSNAGVPVGMIFVANQNGSHNWREAMKIEDFMQGTELLWHTVCDFDKK